MPKLHHVHGAAAVLLAAITASSAQAQLYWDTNGSAAGAGSAGVANGAWTDANWSTSAAGDAATSAYVAASAVVFSAGSDVASAAISVSATQSASSLTVEEGAITLNNGTNAISGLTAITVAGGASLSMGSSNANSVTFNVDGSFTATTFNGGNAMVKNGAGTATFTTRFDAILTVNGGTVYNQNTAAKIKNATINNGGTFRVSAKSFDGTGRVLTVNAGGTFQMDAGVAGDTVTLGSSAGDIVGGAGTSISFNSGTFTGGMSGGLSVTKVGVGTLTYGAGAEITSQGNTTISAGTFNLADNAAMTFYIGANGVNNAIGGVGAANFSGDFIFDLSGAALANGNSWLIVDTGALTESFTSTFLVQGFTETALDSGIWSNGAGLTFTEVNGTLTYSAVPEPASFAAFAGLGVLGVAALRRRRAA